jgi:uncharacterized protein (DUF2267 family)
MTCHHLVELVRDHGRYDTDKEAEDVLRAVLAALGAQVVGDERCDLAAALPDEARAVFATQIPLTQPLNARTFVDCVGRALNTTPAHARWHTTSTLAALSECAGQSLTDRLLTQLPPATPCCSAAPT